MDQKTSYVCNYASFFNLKKNKNSETNATESTVIRNGVANIQPMSSPIVPGVQESQNNKTNRNHKYGKKS